MEHEPQNAGTMPAGVSAARQEHSNQADDDSLLIIVSLLTLCCATVRILLHPGGAEVSLIAAAIWIPFFAMAVGRVRGSVTQRITNGNRRGPHGKAEPPPFQFGLSDLLCAVFVVAFLMGIIAMMSETFSYDAPFVNLWNFMSGSVLAVSAALLISSWRTRNRSGWTVGLPIFLGTLAHMIWDSAADDYILFVWSLLGLWFGFSGLRCREHQAAQTPSV